MQCGKVMQYLWNLGTQILILLWVLKKVDKLHDLQLCLLTASHILKLDVDLIPKHFGSGLTNAEETTHSSPGPARTCWPSPQHEEQEPNDQYSGQHAKEEGPKNDGRIRFEIEHLVQSPFSQEIMNQDTHLTYYLTHHFLWNRPLEVYSLLRYPALTEQSPSSARMCPHCQC